LFSCEESPELYLAEIDDNIKIDYLIGYSVIADKDSFWYLRADTDWSMLSLQLVKHNIKSGEEKVYRIFSSDVHYEWPADAWTTQAVTIPDIITLDAVAKMDSEQATASLAGCTRSEIIAAWGEPSTQLDGLNGDIWAVAGTWYQIDVRYLVDGDSMIVYEVFIVSGTPASEQAVPDDEDIVLIRNYAAGIIVDLKYASTDNFTGKTIYDFTEPSLRYGTVVKLARVQNELLSMGYSLKIWDAYRPFAAHQKLWEICPDPTYVSDPATGTLGHCRANAVDVTLVRADGSEVEMPTGFDDFTSLADRDYSDVSAQAAENALLLQRMMEKYGFKGYYGEWWHYSDTVNYPIIR